VALTVSGRGIPEIRIRVESDVSNCAVSANFQFPSSLMLKLFKISKPGEYAPFHIIVLKVSLHRPLTNDLLTFWSKQSNGESNPLFLYDHLNFLSEYSIHTYIGIRIPRTSCAPENYRVFYESLNCNFSQQNWAVLG
jgi:hypothetical protein